DGAERLGHTHKRTTGTSACLMKFLGVRCDAARGELPASSQQIHRCERFDHCAVTLWSGVRRVFASGFLARRSVRRALILVLVAVVSGFAAYVVNAGNGAS